MVDLHYKSLEEAMLAPVPAPALPPRAGQHGGGTQRHHVTSQPHISEPVPPTPWSMTDDGSAMETRSMRSGSVTSRSSNRLSLTIPIPIALPNAPSSRPTPTSSTMASYPPTPLDTPSLMSPVDPDDFITAIAVQERRVFELRDELTRAELELNKLRRHWTQHEAHKKRPEVRNVQPLQPLIPHIDTPDDPATRRSADLDRRKALLLGQSQANTPAQQYRRRVFRGGHTRTLSLLSPTKASSEGFAVHEDDTRPIRPDSWKPAKRETDLPSGGHYTTIYPTPISKRASWAPRSVHQQTSGVKQIAEDLKTGLWTFMEDLRQATVGEEPITGHGTYLRGIDGNMRSTSRDFTENQDTIRASASSSRPYATSVFEYEDTPTPASRFVSVGDKAGKEKENGSSPVRQNSSASQKVAALSKNSKRFSWQPLSIESMDDNDWSNWESPTVKSPRWSGSTMNGDIITEGAGDETSSKKTPSPKKKSSKSRLGDHSPSPLSPTPGTPSGNKLEELLPPVLNRLTPSNLKKTASHFMKEWEKSLSPPPGQEAEGA